MSPMKKFLLGGVGGLAPVLVSIAVADSGTIAAALQSIDLGHNAYLVLGYAVRVIVLFVVGGVWAYMHRTETDPGKIFQLGLVAPAMISSVISAAQVPRDHNVTAPIAAIEEFFVPPAHAQVQPAPTPQPGTVNRPVTSGWSSFIKGLTGQ